MEKQDYSIKARRQIREMELDGWTHITYEDLLSCVAKEREIVVTSIGDLLFYRDDVHNL